MLPLSAPHHSHAHYNAHCHTHYHTYCHTHHHSTPRLTMANNHTRPMSNIHSQGLKGELVQAPRRSERPVCPASIVGWPADRPADDLGESACTSTSMKQHIQDLPYQLIQVIMLLREMGLPPPIFPVPDLPDYRSSSMGLKSSSRTQRSSSISHKHLRFNLRPANIYFIY